jgi:branched-chain amino acid aminotransferase
MKLTETKFIWRDGRMIEWADAQVHVLSHSMQFGSSAFEGVRCYETPKGPAIFRIQDHLERLINSCKIYRMEVPYTIEQLVDACRDVVKQNEMKSCYIRPMVLRGYGAAGMVPFDSPIETYIPCWPWGTYLGDGALENGVNCCVSTWHRMAPNTTPAAAKVAGNYLGGQLIKMEALLNGFDEGIALGPEGLLSEGSGQNVFVISKGVLYTPSLDGTLLPGITRASLITLAKDNGIEVIERPLPRESLYTADEVFFTGTAAELTPVRSVDKITVGKGKPGPMTLLLQKAYMETVTGTRADPHGWLTYV